MRIAVFDYETTSPNPYGQGVLRVVEQLCEEHEFTVYSTRMDNPRPDRVRWVRVPAVRRPLAALFITFHVLAPLVAALDRRRNGWRPDLVQSLESAMLEADVVGAQFSHRTYLRDHWPTTRPRGTRRLARWTYERLAAALEPRALGRAAVVVVPSAGLGRELAQEFPDVTDRLLLAPNAIDWPRSQPPAHFDRGAMRASLGLPEEAVVFAFVALGHFERKGLPIVLEAMGALDRNDVHLVVVGGTRDLVATFRRQAELAGLGSRAHFVGAQQEVLPFLWASDGFVFPSAYETFSYATFEAAAAGLPIVVSHLHGVEDFLVPGVNGLLVDRTAPAVAEAMLTVADLGPTGRAAMGEAAREAVRGYDANAYVLRWQEAYRRAALARPARHVSSG